MEGEAEVGDEGFLYLLQLQGPCACVMQDKGIYHSL